MTELLQETIDLWHACPAALPLMEKPFDAGDQAAKEEALGRFLESLVAELRRLPRSRRERRDAHNRITSAFVQFARSGISLPENQLELLLDGGFAAIGTTVARQARRFDPGVSTSDILQATRNAWTACALQMLLGQGMLLTPAIFAYSMLYPYTDNYLDAPAVPGEEKSGFSERFGRRLSSEAVSAANSHEDAIWRLVGMIEGQYPRADHPQIFQSLLAIHGAQERSLSLLRHRATLEEADVLKLSFEKGGASVLADAWLAAGSLAPEEAHFAFTWGAALQLADDLQDIRADRQAGVLTIFSRAAGVEPLDELTSRTLQFAQAAIRPVYSLPRAGASALQGLVERSSTSLLIRSAGEAREWHTTDFVAALETYSPFRFAFLDRQRQQLARRSGALIRLFEAFLEGDEDEPAFPLLPSSLMPRI